MKQAGRIMDLFRTDCIEDVSTWEELKKTERVRDVYELNAEGGGSLQAAQSDEEE